MKVIFIIEKEFTAIKPYWSGAGFIDYFGGAAQYDSYGEAFIDVGKILEDGFGEILSIKKYFIQN